MLGKLLKVFIFVACWSHKVFATNDSIQSCDHDLFKAECKKGQILDIQTATYGNTECETNIQENDECLSNVFTYVNTMCTGRLNCSMTINKLERHIRQDKSSCPGERQRYFKVTFQCIYELKSAAWSLRNLKKGTESTNGLSMKVLEFLFIVSGILIIGAILILCCAALCLRRMKRKHERKMQLLSATSLTTSISADNLTWYHGRDPRFVPFRPELHDHYDPRYYLPNLPMAGPHNPSEITPSYSTSLARSQTLPSRHGKQRGYQLHPNRQEMYRPDQPSTSRGQGPCQGYYTCGRRQKNYGPGLPTVTEFLPPPYTPKGAMGGNALPLHVMPRGGSDPYFNTIGRTSSFESMRSKSCETNLDNMKNEAACMYPEGQDPKSRSCDDQLDYSNDYYYDDEPSKQYFQLDPAYM